MSQTMEEASTTVDRVAGGRYRLIGPIGRGGMATVWKARDTALDRDVAIKIFTRAATTSETVAVQEREARINARLLHPGIVTLFDAGVDDTPEHGRRIFLVMELVEGVDLTSRLRVGPMSLAEVAFIGIDIAKALEYLHERDIVHRDIKPGNILTLVGSGAQRAKLTDFGIAAPADRRRVKEGTTSGTAAYLSPEQANLERVNSASDIYSLGLVLLQCVTGRLEFPGDAVETSVRRLVRDPQVPSDLDRQWRALLCAMTARNPDDRPEADEVVAQLTAIAAGQPKTGAPIMTASQRKREKVLSQLRELGSGTDSTLDRLTSLAARTTDCPVALVSVVDVDRVWFMSRHGYDHEVVSLDESLCTIAVANTSPTVIQDAVEDSRTWTNPLVTQMGIGAYAGIPLMSDDGVVFGALCVADYAKREFSDEDVANLVDLAALATDHIRAAVPVSDEESAA